ncbi:hypothetical protein Tco_0351858 [Tanacetum coccineum]
MVSLKNEELSKKLSGIIMIVKMVKLHQDLKHRVLYKVEDMATYLVEYVKFWDDWEVDHYGNANLVTNQTVPVSQAENPPFPVRIRIRTDIERHVSSSRSRKDTHAEDADINSVNNKQPMDEVQLIAEHNILANEQQHYEQSESIYDTYLLEKVDRNTTPDSTDMSHRGGEIDQNAVKCQVSCPLLDPSFDNMTT